MSMTVLHYPDGTEQGLITNDYMIVIEALDSNVKVVDTWELRDGSVHFELAYKTTDEILEDS